LGKVKKIISCIIKRYNLVHVSEVGFKFDVLGHFQAILPMHKLGSLGVKYQHHKSEHNNAAQETKESPHSLYTALQN
jgi:hypothetical protein